MPTERSVGVHILLAVARWRGTQAEVGDLVEGYASGSHGTFRLFREVVSIAIRRRKRRTPHPRRELMLSNVVTDLRHAFRTLRQHPGFALAAMAPVALGVGINTSIFSVLESVVLRPLPAGNAAALVSIHQRVQGARRFISGSRSMLSLPEYRAYRDGVRAFSGVMAYSRSMTVTLGGEFPHEIEGQLVTCNYFDVLQVRPALGGWFSAACDGRDAAPAIVLSHALWTSAFAADPRIVGRAVTVNRHSFTVVGVAPEDFHGTDIVRSAFFAPVATLNLLRPDQPDYLEANRSWLSLVGRRQSGVTVDQARAELEVIASRLDRDQPGRTTTVVVQNATSLSLPEARADIVGAASVVLAAFGLVLLIACANVANLLLARAAGRTKEIAVRLAVGATRRRIVQQLLTESLLIALAGSAAGVLFAWWSSRSVLTLVTASLPGTIPALVIDPRPNVTVLLFALALAVMTAVVFGLVPALQASRPDVQLAIKQDSGGTGRTGWLRGSLLTVQTAVCMMLLVAASLLLRALYQAQTVDPGFDYQNVAVVSFDLRGAGYDTARAALFQREAVARLDSLPGVRTVAQANRPPLSPGRTGIRFHLPGDDQWHDIDVNTVSPEYFSLLDIPIVRGRSFDAAELSGPVRAAIVTEATARRYWPNSDPIGQRLIAGFTQEEQAPIEIVGVTADVQIGRLAQTESSYMYLPASSRAQQELSLLVGSQVPVTAIDREIRAAIGRLDPALAVRVSALEANLDFWRTVARLVASLSTAVALLALLLAAAGVYGVVAYVVSRRVRELAIRMTLGATAHDVKTMILRQTMRPVAVGILIGIAGAAAASQVLESALVGVSPVDPVAFTGAAAFLLVVAGIAGLVPARRALHADPLVALRDD